MMKNLKIRQKLLACFAILLLLLIGAILCGIFGITKTSKSLGQFYSAPYQMMQELNDIKVDRKSVV